MATTLQYGRERAHLGRSLLNFMRITRDAHAPELTLGEIGDLLFTAIEVFVGHAFERPMVLGELSRNLEMPPPLAFNGIDPCDPAEGVGACQHRCHNEQELRPFRLSSWLRLLCARAASGQAAAPLSRVMKSRLPM